MGYDEFGPAYPDAPEPGPSKRSRWIDRALIALFAAALAYWMIVSAASGAEVRTFWVPRIIVTAKDSTVTLWANPSLIFENEPDCKNFLTFSADHIKTMVEGTYGDNLDTYDAKCYMIIPGEKT